MRFTLLFLCLLLAGCGIKPHDISAPEGVSPDPYPRTYPHQ